MNNAKRIVLSMLLTIVLSAMCLCACQSETDNKANNGIDASVAYTKMSDKKVGICIYNFSDNFMTLIRTQLMDHLKNQGFLETNIIIQDAEGDQATQINQIQNFIAEGVDVLIINPVNSSSAPAITDMVLEANIPLIYVNREPDVMEEQRWKNGGWNVTYIGCDARQSGTMQGEIIRDIGIEALDMNGNGKVDYIMVEGDTENIDAQYRTEYSVKALEDAGLDVNCVDDQVGNWDKEQAKGIVANSLEIYGDDIEVVFCNNDAMALGAFEAINEAGRTVGKDIYLVGVDALEDVLCNVIEGKITGTVFNDHIKQAQYACEATMRFINGEKNEYYIGCDYVKVTNDNAQEIMDKLK